jgi:hypothetical protein
VKHDQFEETDLAQDGQYKAALAIVSQRLQQLQSSIFLPDRGTADPRACEQVKANGGYYGPWL